MCHEREARCDVIMEIVESRSAEVSRSRSTSTVWLGMAREEAAAAAIDVDGSYGWRAFTNGRFNFGGSRSSSKSCGWLHWPGCVAVVTNTVAVLSCNHREVTVECVFILETARRGIDAREA